MKTKTIFLSLLCSLTIQLTAQLVPTGIQSINANTANTPSNYLQVDFEKNEFIDGISFLVIEVVDDPDHPANGSWDIEGFESYVRTTDAQIPHFWDFVASTHLFVHIYDQSFEFNAPLPVELLSFTGLVENKQIVLSWETAWEYDFDHFVIEYATDGRHFQAVANKQGNNKGGTYIFIDRYRPNGTHYYRLQLVDRYGPPSYTKILAITLEGIESLKIYPTITSGKIYSNTKEQRPFKLFSIAGQKMLEGTLSEELDISHFIPGYYCLRIENERPLIILLKR